MSSDRAGERRRALVLAYTWTEARSLKHVASELARLGWAVDAVAVQRAAYHELTRSGRRIGNATGVVGSDCPLRVRSVLAQRRPDVVVLGNDAMPYCRWLIEAAQEAGARVVLIQEAPTQYAVTSTVRRGPESIYHQWCRVKFLFWSALANRRLKSLLSVALCTLTGRCRIVPGYGHAEVDLLCVGTEAIARRYAAAGSKARRIVATGIPELAKMRPADSTQYDVLLLTQNLDGPGWCTPARKVAFFRDVVRIVREELPGARILCKCHPQERVDEYGCLGVDAFEEDLGAAIASSRMAVSVCTTAFIDVFCNGKSAVAYVPEFVDVPEKEIFTDVLLDMDEMGLVVRTETEFRAVVRRQLARASAEEPVAEFRRRYDLCLDGNAAARIASEVSRLVIDGSGLDGRRQPESLTTGMKMGRPDNSMRGP